MRRKRSDNRDAGGRRGTGPAGWLQRIGGGGLVAAGVLLAANSLFLFITPLPEPLAVFMLRLHAPLGIAFAAILLVFAAAHVALHGRHPNGRARLAGVALLTLLLTGCGLGLALYAAGSAVRSGWLMPAHQALFLAALAGYGLHRGLARATPLIRLEAAAVALCLLLLAGLWAARGAAGGPRATPAEASPPTDYGLTRARTASGHYLDEADLANPDYCAGCHEQIAEQWRGSAHRFSSFNDPFYAATFDVSQSHRSAKRLHFCAGCHDPLILHSGNFDERPIGKHTPQAEAGITCLACHAITRVRGRKGNGGYVVAEPDRYPYYGSPDPAKRALNRRLIRAKPAKHKRSFMKPFMRTSELCLACHKAHIPGALNRYKWKRGQNDYDPWHDSAAGNESARTFYESDGVLRCQDCHMPEVASEDPAADDGMARDHTFAGGNTALAAVKEKPRWLEKTRDMLRGAASVDVLAATSAPGSPAETRLLPLEAETARAAAGRALTVSVVVHNRRVGHMFPGGTIDMNQPWLHFTVRGPGGEPLYESGALDAEGRLDPAAHVFHSVLLTRQGKKIRVHNVETFYTGLYNNAVPLGASAVVRYRFRVPAELKGEALSIEARLRHRKFSRDYTEFALGPSAPRLPITEVANDSASVRVAARARAPEAAGGKALARRINNLGIGHLRRGDLRAARRAFRRVAEMRPESASARINLARVHWREGALGPMERALRAADRRKPGDPTAAYFLGELEAARGRYEAAIAAYDRTLAAFPEDRVVLNAKGTALLKRNAFEKAIAVFERTLEIDPENRAAHTHLFRAHRALGESEAAERHRELADRYRTRSREQRVTREYRRNHPHADREADAQHIHRLSHDRGASGTRARQSH